MGIIDALQRFASITDSTLTPEQKAKVGKGDQKRKARFYPAARLPYASRHKFSKQLTFDAAIEIYQDRERWEYYFLVTGFAAYRPTETNLNAHCITQGGLNGPYRTQRLAETAGRRWARENLAIRNLQGEYGPVLRSGNRLVEIPNKREYWILPGKGSPTPHAKQHVWCVQFTDQHDVKHARRVPWEDVLTGDIYERNADDTDRTADALELWDRAKPLQWTFDDAGDEPRRDAEAPAGQNPKSRALGSPIGRKSISQMELADADWKARLAKRGPLLNAKGTEKAEKASIELTITAFQRD